MKRLALLLTLLFIFAPFVVYADVIFTPENNFYQKYENQIVNLGRRFVAASEDGNVPVKKDPGAKRNIAELNNGTATYIQYSCLYDGDFWGYTSEYSGWVKLDQTLVLYDYVAFEEDHIDEFYVYDGDFSEIKNARSAIAWPWPGADALLWTYEDLNTDSFGISYAYKDDDGREWGFVAYLYGSRNFWICLSEPVNRDMPVFNPEPDPVGWVSETAHTDIRLYMDEQKDDFTTVIIIIVLVVVLVAGTAVLIRIFWKPDKVKTGEQNDV